MKLKKNNTGLYLTAIFAVALLIGIGYAALTSVLNINGQTTIGKASWDIHFENLVTSVSGSTVTNLTTTPLPEEITSSSKTTTISFSATMTQPGDGIYLEVDEVNAGTIDAMISSVVKTGLTAEQAKYLDYKVTYSDGASIEEKQLLAAGKKEKIAVFVNFKKDVVASDLPANGATLNLSFSINYQQADDSAVAISHPVCKRATTLHTEICGTGNCSAGGSIYGDYLVGDTITYGNLGTKGVLTSGDAFDCDVNGDGTFNSETERFYYVSGKDGDNASYYATLIYYKNLKTSAYSTYKVDLSSYAGPEISRLQLPSPEEWPNVKLSNITRNILDEKGIVRVENFSYVENVARLLTYQEISTGCDGVTNLKEKCLFLSENTNYASNGSAYWLENVYSSKYENAWACYGTSLQYSGGDNQYVGYSHGGLRPAIEVLKSQISY